MDEKLIQEEHRHEEKVVDKVIREKRDYILPVSILVAALLIAGAVIFSAGKGTSVPSVAVPGGVDKGTANAVSVLGLNDRDVILGAPKAPVTVIEYGDYQCPFCGRFFTQIEGPLREEYIKTGKVKMVFRNFSFLGPESTAAAEATECAKDQKQYWGYHDALYVAEITDGKENSGNLTRALFLSLAQKLKFDMPSFTSCVDSKKYAAQVTKDTTDGQTSGVNSTPTAFVNGVKIQGAVPYADFKAAVETALSAR